MYSHWEFIETPNLSYATHNLMIQIRAAFFNGHGLERDDAERNRIGRVETIVVNIGQLVYLNFFSRSFGPHHSWDEGRGRGGLVHIMQRYDAI